MAEANGARRFRVGFIGTGGRSCVYAQCYQQHGGIDIVALADPDPEHRAAMAQRVRLDGSQAEFSDWRDLLAQTEELDGVVISSPNHTHADAAVACFERGLPIALEKPLAATWPDCDRIIAAERANAGRSLLGFVLRSTPFYGAIHGLLRGGAVGRLLSVQADELVGWAVTSIMNRSPWRRYQSTSGGAMLEKCCHDLDILNWMCDSRVMSLNSYGGRRIFTPDPTLPETCDDCRVAESCRYYKAPRKAAHEDEAEHRMHEFVRSEEAKCIYNIDADVVDVQSVCLEYENGVVATFLMNFHCAGEKTSRNFHAVGTQGRVWGNLHEAKVYHYDNSTGETTVHDARGDGSGHGGGDRIHALLLERMMAEPGFRPDQGATAGYRSAALCFAADISRTEGRRVDLGYLEDGRMVIA